MYLDVDYNNAYNNRGKDAINMSYKKLCTVAQACSVGDPDWHTMR